MTTSPQGQQRHKHTFWIRLIFGGVALLLLVAGTLIWILSIEHFVQGDWSNVLPPIFGVLGVGLALCQWLFPLTPVEAEQSKLLVSPQLASSQGSSVSAAQNVSVIHLQSADTQTSQSLKGATRKDIHTVFHFNESLVDPREFFGRVREKTTLISRTRTGASTSLIGPRRIGKTWLITYLKLVALEELDSGFPVAYLDATMPSCSTLAGFTGEAVKGLGIPLPMVDQSHLNLATLEMIVKDLRARNQIPVLCIDEFESFCQLQGFTLSVLTNLRAITQAGLCLITISKRPLMDIVIDRVGESGKTSPFFNVFEQLTLKPFRRSEAEHFAQVKGTQADFNDEEHQQLLKYGQKGKQQWLPLRLQLVGKMLQEDKILAERENPEYYRPQDPIYWAEFEKRLAETFRGTVP